MAVCSKADALIYALTGEEHALDSGPIESRLSACGWSVQRLLELRDDRRCNGLMWPFPVSAELLSYGHAAFTAELDQARRDLGLNTPPQVPGRARPLNSDERRLIADRPPHWG